MRISRRRMHVGGYAETPPTMVEVGIPPQPLPPNVAIVNSDGTPTVDFYQWLMLTHDWRSKLFRHLGGTFETPPETP
jgi:hypothetical protein